MGRHLNLKKHQNGGVIILANRLNTKKGCLSFVLFGYNKKNQLRLFFIKHKYNEGGMKTGFYKMKDKFHMEHI